MSVGIIAGFILFLVGAWFVAEPLFVGNRARRSCGDENLPEVPHSARVEELELDYRLGKMSEQDYNALKAVKSDPALRKG